MKITPEFPSPMVSPTGESHSTCSWQSANFSAVTAGPDEGTQTKRPSLTVHFEGPPFDARQFFVTDSAVPSKRTIASLGGLPGRASILTGSGRFTSWTAQACRASGRSPDASPQTVAAVKSVAMRVAEERVFILYAPFTIFRPSHLRVVPGCSCATLPSRITSVRRVVQSNELVVGFPVVQLFRYSW